jgi:photosystem II stability/assembly factor-like uncharacterized protein
MSIAERYLPLFMACVLLSAAAPCLAHDASAYGGLFRSRNFGASWLNADVGLFLSGAVSVAVNPVDPNRLMLGTDGSLLTSRSGGRRWEREAPEKLYGAVFAVVFSADGKLVLCSTPAGVFRNDGSGWEKAIAPVGAAPARVIAFGASPSSIYLVGRNDLYHSTDSGRQWARVEYELPAAQFTALVVDAQSQESLLAIVNGHVMASNDQGHAWQRRDSGLPAASADTLVSDPAVPGRLWTAIADRVYRSDDRGTTWRGVGRALPEAGTSVRGIAADFGGRTLLLATQRGLYRSADAGDTWALVEGNLPVHLEAGLLARDPTDGNTVYVGFALMPYAQIWRVAVEGGNLLGRLDVVSVAGGIAFLVLIGVGGLVIVAWLARHRTPPPIARRESSK